MKKIKISVIPRIIEVKSVRRKELGKFIYLYTVNLRYFLPSYSE